MSQVDVFLAHNSLDKPQVKAIAEELERRGLKPWLDDEQIPPGRLFQDEIQKAISRAKTAAIFVGSQGLGRWQNFELQVFMKSCVEKNIPVIPVLLPGVSRVPEDLLFLELFRWISFSPKIDNEYALNLLVWAINVQKPTPLSNSDEKPGCVPTSNDISSIFQIFGLNIAKYTVKRLLNNWLIKFLVEKFLLYQEQDDIKLTKVEDEKIVVEITKQEIVTKTIKDLLQPNNDDSGSERQLGQVLSEIQILLKQLLNFLISSAQKRIDETKNETEKDVKMYGAFSEIKY